MRRRAAQSRITLELKDQLRKRAERTELNYRTRVTTDQQDAATTVRLLSILTLLFIVGGVFMLEGLSVVIQVASFKMTGQRVFKMAPLHHHFELIGWQESKVVTRFLILAIIFALLSLATLKLR